MYHALSLAHWEATLSIAINTTSLEELQKAIELRDKKDSTRKVSPLTQAPDAIKLDTTNMTIDEVVSEISKIIKKTQDELA